MAAMLLTRWPVTGGEIATGKVVDLVSYGVLGSEEREITCPLCGATHRWSRDNTWISLRSSDVAIGERQAPVLSAGRKPCA